MRTSQENSGPGAGEDQEAAESSVLEEKYPEMWRHPLKTMLNLINSSNKIS